MTRPIPCVFTFGIIFACIDQEFSHMSTTDTSQVMLPLSALAVILLTFPVAIHADITQTAYVNSNCTGSVIMSITHQEGVCNLGGLVYTCERNRRCLQIETFSENAACVGTPTVKEWMPCDVCNGGSDTDESTIVSGCDSPHPAIYTCQSSMCSSGTCQVDGSNLTIGCDGALDIQTPSCSQVIMQDYSDYETCQGSMLSQIAMAAGVCIAGTYWSCD